MSTPREKTLEKDVEDWKRLYFQYRDRLLTLRADNLALYAGENNLRAEVEMLERDQDAFRAQIRCDQATIRKLREQSSKDDHEIAALRAQVRVDHGTQLALRTTIEALRQSVATKNCIIEAFVDVAMAREGRPLDAMSSKVKAEKENDQ